ncbi:MAG: manganese efflux pump, partial [Oscillospiraceae bacterium]
NIFSYLLNSWFIKLVSAALMLILVVLSARQYILSLSLSRPKIPTLQNILVEPLLADTDNCKDITSGEAILVGIAVGMDASAASVVLAFAGASIIFIPLAMGAAHFILVGIGNICGRYGFKNRSQHLRLIPVVLFSILFISRVFLLL